MSTVKIYTDGGCSGNQEKENIGGWGAVLTYGESLKEIHGGEKNTTNNRMELTAVIQALKLMKRSPLDIEIYSDSSYVANCFREKWYINWEKNNWKTAAKKPVENKDLWMELIKLYKEHRIKFFRVKGHVNINSPSTNLEAHFLKFLKTNGNNFSLEDFKYITRMNNRADQLANMGIDELRE